MITPPFNPGDRVKFSEYALRSYRDRWLNAGSSSLKTACLDELNRQSAIRGVVVSCERGKYGFSVNVKTDAGGLHSSMPNLWKLEEGNA
jgi:hypothetical protein